MRLFFAIELPPEVRAGLGRLRGDSPAYRWVDPALIHLTLAFLGEQPEERLAALERVGAAAAGSAQTGTLQLGDAGSFGAARAPRVLWVDVRGEVDRLAHLQTTLETQLSRAGFPVEQRPFRAHITLARRRERASGGPPEGWPPQVEHASFRIEALTLMHSRLSPRGPTYTPVKQFRLAG